MVTRSRYLRSQYIEKKYYARFVEETWNVDEKCVKVTARVLINSRFGVSYTNFSFLTPTFWKVSIEKYGKTPNSFWTTAFYSNFQNPSENPDWSVIDLHRSRSPAQGNSVKLTLCNSSLFPCALVADKNGHFPQLFPKIKILIFMFPVPQNCFCSLFPSLLDFVPLKYMALLRSPKLLGGHPLLVVC